MHTALPVQLTTALSLFKSAYSALIAGSRTIPLGDNGAVIKELAASTSRQATRGETRDPFRKA